MVAAVGAVDGVHAVAFCSDATVMGGAMGKDGCDVVVRAYERALADRRPIVGLWHSGGARLAEGVLSLHAVGPDLLRDDPGVRARSRRSRWCSARRPVARPTGRR